MEPSGVSAPRSGKYFGIDLGTSNSVISVFESEGPRVVKVDGRDTLPSVVAVDKEGTVFVGRTAANRALADPARVIRSTKRLIGREESVRLGEKDYSPAELSGMILSKLCDLAYEAEGEALGGRPHDVVICVPANFLQDQKDETRRAAELAGLNCVAMLEEPVAAAIAYAMRNAVNQTILVYDFGGGTLDVSILRAKSSADGVSLEVLGFAGDPELGGDDFDAVIMDMARDDLRSRGFDLPLDASHPEIGKSTLRAALQRIKIAAVEAKHDLAELDEAHVLIDEVVTDHEGKTYSIDFTVTREDFEARVRPLIDRSLPIIDAALREAKLDKADIDKIVLAGGTTKMPLIRSVLREYCDRDVWGDKWVDTAIAQGAAIWCDEKKNPRPSSAPIEIENIVTHYLGLELKTGQFDVLIEKGQKLESTGLSVTKEYTNSEADVETQTVRLFESDVKVPAVRLARDEVEDIAKETGRAPMVRCIGEFVVPIPKGPARSVRTEITMSLDENNLLRVSARSAAGQEEMEISRKAV